MTTRWLGASISRHEDARLLTGQGRFVDDIDPPDALHAAFVRAPIANGYIRGIDLSEARHDSRFVAAFTYHCGVRFL
jgi:aerobic carbon-monoxide dehydrogenase large subunit